MRGRDPGRDTLEEGKGRYIEAIGRRFYPSRRNHNRRKVSTRRGATSDNTYSPARTDSSRGSCIQASTLSPIPHSYFPLSSFGASAASYNNEFPVSHPLEQEEAERASGREQGGRESVELAVLSSPFSPPPPFTEWKKVKGPAPMRRGALRRRTDPIDVEEKDDDDIAVVFAKNARTPSPRPSLGSTHQRPGEDRTIGERYHGRRRED